MKHYSFTKHISEPSIHIYNKNEWQYVCVNNLQYFLKENPNMKEKIRGKIKACLQNIPRSVNELFEEIIHGTQVVFLKHPEYPGRIVGVSAINVFNYKNGREKTGYILQLMITSIDKDVHGKGAFSFFPVIHTAEYVNHKWIGSHYSCRTYTPRVYGTMYRRLSIHPDLKNWKDNNKMQDLMTSFVDYEYDISDDRFEPDKQIFRGIYDSEKYGNFGSDDMPIRPDREEIFNEWFAENIDRKRGDGLLVFSDIGLKETVYTYFARFIAFFRRKKAKKSLSKLLEIER